MINATTNTESVGINYTIADDGLRKYKKQRSDMENYLRQAENLQTNHPDEWTGADEDALQQIITDARNNLKKMDENIAALHGFLSNAKTGHKANEARNANLLTNAYVNATV